MAVFISKDHLNLLSKLTLSRLYNGGLLFFSYYISRFLKKAIHLGSPISIAMEPTTSCNLRCPECPSGLRDFTRSTGMLEPSFYRKVIDEIYKHTHYLTFYFQGEPFLNKGFLDMVSYASKKNIYTATSTNAHYFDEETAKKTVESGLDRLIISLDGTTQDTYEQYRIGGTLNKVIEGTKEVLKWKKALKSKTPHIRFQFLVVKPNEHQIEDAVILGNELGVDEVVFKTAQIYDYKNGSPLIPENDQYSRYKKTSTGYVLKNKLLNQCWKMWQSCVITWDGKVVPCCFDKDAKHQLGDLKENKLNDIWRSSGYQNFRKSILKGRSQIDICKNCTEGTKVFED